MDSEIILSAEQRAVVDAVSEGQNAFVTGPAGTGKSVTLEAIKRANPRMEITATTGIAALNVGGMTIHRFAGLGLVKAETKASKIVQNLRAKQRPGEPGPLASIRKTELLAIDEMSMLGAHTLDVLEKVFRLARETDLPFGGCQILAFGDFLQLPAVNDKFAFESKSWSGMEFQEMRLTKTFRQEDQEFANVLHRIRIAERVDGSMTQDVTDLLKECLDREVPAEFDPVTLMPLNRGVDQINAQRLKELNKRVFTYDAAETGHEYDRFALNKGCQAPATLRLSVGARVMLLVNYDVENGLANGTTGTVETLSDYRVKVRFDNGDLINLDRHVFELEERGVITAARTQYPLKLAWAVSIHKSQGQTLTSAIIHLADCFEYGQAYVALSRVKAPEGIFLANSKKGVIKADPRALYFYGLGPRPASMAEPKLELFS